MNRLLLDNKPKVNDQIPIYKIKQPNLLLFSIN